MMRQVDVERTGRPTGMAALGSYLFRFTTVTFLLLTLLLIFYPLGSIFYRAFTTAGHFSLAPFVEAISDPTTLKVLGDTFFVVSISTVAALVLGCFFAWVNERTDANAGAAAEILPLIPLLVPQIAGVIGWVTLLSPQAGFINAFLRQIFEVFGVSLTTGPLNIFSYTGLICIMSLYLVPFVYLTVSAALQQLNPSLEEAARISGASPVKILWTITIPSIKPAIINAAILIVIYGISLFSVPIIIGTSADIDLLSARIYRLLYTYPPRLDMAIALAIFMMAFIQVALLLQVLVLRAGRFAVIAGKGQAHSKVELGKWRLPAKSMIITYLMLTAVIPLISLAVVSLQPFWSPRINVSTFSLQHFVYVLFDNSMSVRALINSIGLGIVGATIGIVLAAMFVVYSRNASLKGQTFVEFATAVPATVPHTVVAVAMVVTFTGGFFRLHGTLVILLLAYLLLTITQAVRSARVAHSQVGNDLVEAAEISSASAMRIFTRILLPLMIPGLIAGWVILFVNISGELTASALLSSTANPVVGLVLLDMWENGSFPQLAAIALVMTVLDIVVVAAVLRLFKLRSAIR